MAEQTIGYLKFNDFVDQLVDNQIWMQKIESFAKEQPSIKNNDQIFDPLEGKVRTADGVIDYTELMNIDSPNLKTRCYIASFTRLCDSNFENGKIKTKTAYNLEKLSGQRDFAVLESDTECKRGSSLEKAISETQMSARIGNSNIPLGYLDAKDEIKNYVQQVILFDAVAQRRLGSIDPAVSSKISKSWDPKHEAFSIMTESTQKDASKHIESLGIKHVASLIEALNMDVLQKIMRNVDTKYIKKMEPLIGQEKTNELIKSVDLQRCNPLKPSNINVSVKLEKITYTDCKIAETKEETIQKAKKSKKYRDWLIKKCIFEKPCKFASQQESRVVLIARETIPNQEFPCVMNVQYYKEPLLKNEDGSMEYLIPIQSQKFYGWFIYYFRKQYLIDLCKSITEEKYIRAYPNVATRIPRKYL